MEARESYLWISSTSKAVLQEIHDTLLQANFKASEADLCLLYKEDQETGVCIMLIYINDMLIVGKTKAIEDAIQVLQQSFEVRKPTMLEAYLGMQVIKGKNGK